MPWKTAKLQRTTYCREIEASARLNLPGMLTCWCRAVKKDIELVVSCNTPIEETAIALFGIGAQKSNMRLSELARLCNTVARFSGQPIHAAKPIVGSRIFFHEFSIHCAGLLKDTNFYELYDPGQVGRRNSRQMVLGAFRLSRHKTCTGPLEHQH